MGARKRDGNYAVVERQPAAFATLLIASDTERSALIHETAVASRSLTILRSPVGYPSARELLQLLNQWQPEVILVDLEDEAKATACLEQVRESCPRAPVIGVAPADMTAHRPYVLAYPPSPEQLRQLVHKGVHAFRGRREEGLLVFVPAKAGCGASTLALNTAGAIAAEGKRVLLVDADLHSGATGVMVHTSEGATLQRLLNGISELDRFRLEEAVCQSNGFDMLVSDGGRVWPLPQWEDYFRLLDVARGQYDTVVVDLPEVINPATQEFVQRARGVYVVTTQELLPVKLTSRRLEELASYAAEPDDVHVVINRRQRGEADAEAIQGMIGQPVHHEFPNDYYAVRRALQEGALVDSGTALGRSIREFARKAIGADAQRSRLASLLRFA